MLYHIRSRKAPGVRKAASVFMGEEQTALSWSEKKGKDGQNEEDGGRICFAALTCDKYGTRTTSVLPYPIFSMTAQGQTHKQEIANTPEREGARRRTQDVLLRVVYVTK